MVEFVMLVFAWLVIAYLPHTPPVIIAIIKKKMPNNEEKCYLCAERNVIYCV